MTIWGLAFSLLTAWSLLITFVGVPMPVIIKDGEEITLTGDPMGDEAFSVEKIISLKKGPSRVILHAMGEECLWRFIPLCVFATLAPSEFHTWWIIMLVFAVGFAVAHTQYSTLIIALIYLPLGIVWGTIYLYLLEWFGAPGLVVAFVGVSVWHSIPNLKRFRYRVSKLLQLQKL